MRERTVNGRWALMVPDQIAEWDAPSMWERARFESLHRHLHLGDVLFDIGTEHGWISAIIARDFVGPENIVLFEPSPDFWVNIRKTWIANGLADPLDCWAGFVADVDQGQRVIGIDGRWPIYADPERAEVAAMPYRYFGRDGDIPSITIDSYIEITENMPMALNIDVEGFELHVIRGAERTLRSAIPMFVWISIHPDLLQTVGHSDAEVHELMREFGYEGEHLATDHEEHWLFTTARWPSN